MKIQVTQEDINNGMRRNGNKCPVTLAIKRATGIALVSSGLTICVYGRRELIPPVAVTEFIEQFDAGNPVSPFEFNLPIDQP